MDCFVDRTNNNVMYGEQYQGGDRHGRIAEHPLRLEHFPHHDIGSGDHVERDLMLIKVKAPAERRGEIIQLGNIFRSRIVDANPETLVIEISGQERKIEAFIEMMRPFGIVELARTGRIALARGSNTSAGETTT